MKQPLILLGLTMTLGVLSSKNTSAQCNAGEVEITMDVITDGYGYEGYWEIVPVGNGCGNGTIASGGNTSVGCVGGGAQNQTPGGYGNNQTFNEGPWCLNDASIYELHFVDDYGDGGFEFRIYANGYQINTFEGTGSGNVFTFAATEPYMYDLAVYAIEKPYAYTAAGNVDVTASVFNYGTATITSMDVNYQIDGGATQTSNLTGLNIPSYEEYQFVHPTPWNVSNGTYVIKIWASNLNGNADLNTSNDDESKNIEVGPGIPNIIDQYLTTTAVIEEIGNSSDQLDKPTDLDFHPVLTRREMWVINKKTENSGGSTTIYTNTGLTNQTDVNKQDGNAWHFMSMPTGIAFGENGNFANSPGVWDANHQGSGTPFTGPALWSSDLTIYAQPSGGNGSHLDMLHCSPYSQGIAHEKDNVYWVFDGNGNDLVRYDFGADHGPGNTDHGDGVVYRYSDVSVAKDPNDKIVSHIVVDKSTNWLYVVDHGNDRVIRMDINTGSLGGTPAFGPFEGIAGYKYMTGYTWENVVTTGLVDPAGIDVIDNRMIVSDYTTGDIIIYDISAMPAIELGRIATGAQGIMGVKIGPDGKIYYVDYDANTVNLVNGNGLSVEENSSLKGRIYPNPSNGNNITIQMELKGNYNITVLDNSGRVINQNSFKGDTYAHDFELSSGNYFIKITDEDKGVYITKRLIIQ